MELWESALANHSVRPKLFGFDIVEIPGREVISLTGGMISHYKIN